jgi:hypothetical protein
MVPHIADTSDRPASDISVSIPRLRLLLEETMLSTLPLA